MRSLGGGGHSGGGRSFGGGSSGNRSFGGFRAGGSGRTRRVGSPGSGNSSVSGGSSSGGGFNVGDAISIAFILLELFGPFGALLAGGIILSVYMFTVSTFAGLVTTAISVAAVVFCLVYKKRLHVIRWILHLWMSMRKIVNTIRISSTAKNLKLICWRNCVEVRSWTKRTG